MQKSKVNAWKKFRIASGGQGAPCGAILLLAYWAYSWRYEIKGVKELPQINLHNSLTPLIF